MARQLSAQAETALKRRESPGGVCVLTPYPDQKGVPTVGWGHTGDDVNLGQPWTLEQCEAAFKADTQSACACVEKAVKVPLNDDQFGALVSFTYNIGNYAFETKFSGLKSLNKGDYAGIPKHLDAWENITVNGKLIKDPGLANRRNSEDGQWVSESYVRSANITPTVPPVWYQHPKVKALATAAAGISGAGITTAASQAQTLSASWHPAVYAFIALSVVGIVIGIVKQHNENG